MANTVPCAECGKPVNLSSSECRHCGAEDPARHAKKKAPSGMSSRGWLIVGGVVALVIGLVISRRS